MSKYLKYFIFTLLLFLFQFIFSDILDIQGIFPDLILIFIIYMAFRIPPFTLIILAFLLGLIQDLFFNISLIGLSPLIKIIFALFTLKLVILQRSLNSIIILILYSFLILLAINLYDSLYYFSVESENFLLFYRHSLPKIIYTLTIFLLVNFYYPLIRIR